MHGRGRVTGIKAARILFAVFLIVMILTNMLPLDLPFTNSVAQAGTAVPASDLYNTVIRIRPVGNRTSDEVGTSVGVNDNGDGGVTRKNVL